MNTQVNWQKIRNEVQRLADVDTLKSEVQRIGSEIRNFDYTSVLSPAAQARVRMFEKRYAEIMRALQVAQRQMDREFNRIVRQLKDRGLDVTKLVALRKLRMERDAQQKKSAKMAKMKKSAAARKKPSTTRAKAKSTRKTKTTARKRKKA